MSKKKKENKDISTDSKNAADYTQTPRVRKRRKTNKPLKADLADTPLLAKEKIAAKELPPKRKNKPHREKPVFKDYDETIAKEKEDAHLYEPDPLEQFSTNHDTKNENAALNINPNEEINTTVGEELEEEYMQEEQDTIANYAIHSDVPESNQVRGAKRSQLKTDLGIKGYSLAEVLTSKTENLMLRGVRDRFQIAEALGIIPYEAEKYIKLVRLRWSVQSREHNAEELRTDLMKTYDLLQANLWNRVQKLMKDVKEGNFITRVKREKGKDGEVGKTVAILDRAKAEQVITNMFKTLGSFQRHRAEIGGLTKTVIENNFSVAVQNNHLAPQDHRALEESKLIFFEVAAKLGYLKDEDQLPLEDVKV